MKKILYLTFALVALGAFAGVINARLTGVNPGTDVFCVGPSGAEACVDVNGSLIPTTASDADLGTSALPWSAGYIDTLTVNTTLTMPSSSVTTAKIATSAVTTGKLYLDLPIGQAACVTTAKILGTCSDNPNGGGGCSCT